ncbi:GNAT family N-acetyltransferase [Burkholderia thailandensis]|uniref:GNAT family N-acetyltransferase n=1 Tax=Burkholderia thailandensis TaxID=57975 RepID=UPI0003ECB104|nr:GNAT family N-acetyltransferase [Burkholderia thailandensis]AHI66781.1 acetyltransferase domain protein [Burkholderia thailandensis H0587]AOI53685.1 GCN5 family acetyltransferase [Burkholderia thailandensis]AOJ52691.1 GCN5 family acetyltransferase [Burkholderia thailandensis]AVR29212.1 N-acetyltransferase [Burkholderia thailandensis]MCZ2896997.1 GNAT family N-acetyltransferase [Burkholderia thailandensis]
MPQQRVKSERAMHFACATRANGRVVLRRFDPAHDSYDELTALLHRAFTRLGRMGLNCPCVDQPAAVTRQRALAGECFVAVCNGHLVATMTLHARDLSSPCELYRRGNVATLRQFGVDPVWQGRGIGRSMLDFATRWAAARGYRHLALDTPQPAAHLVAFYTRHGFRLVDVMHFSGKGYDSAILSKPAAVSHPPAWNARELPLTPAPMLARFDRAA